MKSFNESNRTKHYKGYKVLIDNSLKDGKEPIFGETDTKKKVVKINVKHNKKSGKKGELVDTLAHELLGHADHPRMSEKQVYKRTAKLRLSKKTKSKLLSLVHKK